MSDQVRHPEDRFSHNEAHLITGTFSPVESIEVIEQGYCFWFTIVLKDIDVKYKVRVRAFTAKTQMA